MCIGTRTFCTVLVDARGVARSDCPAGVAVTEIAERLCVSPETVAHHLRDMLTRADARNRAELLARAFVSGLLRDDDWPPVPTGRRCIPHQWFMDERRQLGTR